MKQIDGFTAPYLIHLGCNETKIQGWVNVDARKTGATDLVHDCGNLEPFADQSANMIYSNAFFEHLTMEGRVALLKEAFRALTEDGFLYFSGVPDFESVARCYLDRRQGNVSPRFDLFEVYRYTHGNPEHQSTWWMEQLHKTLFDVETIKILLAQAGFRTCYVYRYAYGDEPNAINLGFMAWKMERLINDDAARLLIKQFSTLSRPNMDRLELNL